MSTSRVNSSSRSSESWHVALVGPPSSLRRYEGDKAVFSSRKRNSHQPPPLVLSLSASIEAIQQLSKEIRLHEEEDMLVLEPADGVPSPENDVFVRHRFQSSLSIFGKLEVRVDNHQ